MIYPSVDKLLNIVDSKYKLVHIAADRAKVMKEHKHFQANENEELHIKEDENSGVMWIPIQDLEKVVREPEMMPVYRKLLREYIAEK